VVIAGVLVLSITLFLSLRSDPKVSGDGLQTALANLKKMIEGDPAKKPAPATKGKAVVTGDSVQPMRAGRRWTYRVSLEPAQWRDAELDYRTAELASGITVHTEFRHAQGKMNFQLGVFSPNHPSHASVRFPGFFMHAAYLDKPLVVGQRFAWQWPWQLPGGAVREGRVKRYAGELKAWEDVASPAGTFAAARIETSLEYVDNGRVTASARETLWYSPKAGQFVRVVREGATPDEGFKRIVAELAALY
jgi:hypothetical protein